MYSVALILDQHCHAADVSRAEDLAKAEELAMDRASVFHLGDTEPEGVDGAIVADV
jgi:hypothetical protein